MCFTVPLDNTAVFKIASWLVDGVPSLHEKLSLGKSSGYFGRSVNPKFLDESLAALAAPELIWMWRILQANEPSGFPQSLHRTTSSSLMLSP